MESARHNGCFALVMLVNLFHMLLVMNALLFYWLVTMGPMVVKEPFVVLFSSLLWLLQYMLQFCNSWPTGSCCGTFLDSGLCITKVPIVYVAIRHWLSYCHFLNYFYDWKVNLLLIWKRFCYKFYVCYKNNFWLISSSFLSTMQSQLIKGKQ